MTFFQWMAIVGAAAWVPQIAGAVYRFFVKPVLHFVAVPQGELTFNALGPIVNVRAAIVAERKDAVIVEMRMHLRHEKGREIELVWDSFVEHFSEMRTQAGERGEFMRDQIATALKVSTALPVEKFFRFRDPEFVAQQREPTAKADDRLKRISNDDETALEDFLKSKEFSHLVRFYNNSFYWEPGRYELTLVTRVLGVRRPRVAETYFVLSEDDIDRIRKNLPLLEKRLEEISRGVPAEDLTLPGFWATPRWGATALTLRPN